ncbi:AAA family ATPase [Marinobacter sp. R17]|uniref:AAA family ATPase n=1 Tax=Marinobacter sp. R17 TaxID=2484250 RepID=UPI000F4CFCEF|nr:AAA family ATPase [Marinobacter sp. R17]ROU00076.1 AAA family ATPase [Marinobacter sp. R17]
MSEKQVYWFVGASYGGTEDQTERFLEEGIWENGYRDKLLDKVREMQPGERIAIKSSYTRKHGLSFESGGQTVSVMAIKAIGTITRNVGDGRRVEVAWDQQFDPAREWYFYTNRSTVWKVIPDDWMREGLVNFAFAGGQQEISRFRNHPYWRERFGEVSSDKKRFRWTLFYEAFAKALLNFRQDRAALVTKALEIAQKYGLTYLDKKGLDDICPFTTMGMFNRGVTDANRIAIAQELADFLGVDEAVPNSFEGIPILNNQKSWFFAFSEEREPNAIDNLWNLFELAQHQADQEDDVESDDFTQLYDEVASQLGVGWNLTMGLYWIRPWSYLTLDAQSQEYITKKLELPIPKQGGKGRCTGRDYIGLIRALEKRFQEDSYQVHSFPDLSLAAWLYNADDVSAHPNAIDPDDVIDGATEPSSDLFEPYGIETVVNDGCFIRKSALENILQRLEDKKNIILQGPPGTGKTWLAKRMAYALMGEKAKHRLSSVQFHPNLSYEDFVRGYRPVGGEKGLELVDGPFMNLVERAKNDPGHRYVMVIEEVNRGNPAQIFGELLTLIEADKRNPDDALELSHHRAGAPPVYVPENLFIIGTMNVADRSLALVDMALRRRFAFLDLEPELNETWKKWVSHHFDVDIRFLEEIRRRVEGLNSTIRDNPGLGKQFLIGHSYFTPARNQKVIDPLAWFEQVVETEITPLLEEYWFDNAEKPQQEASKMLEGL